MSQATSQPSPRARAGFAAGSEEERYVRALQVAGRAPWHQWSLRPFGPRELRALLPRDGRHPWARELRGAVADTSDRAASLIRPELRALGNSSFPYSINDGAVWAGKGVTLAASGGGYARYRWLSARLEPIAFVAQNASFPLMPNGVDGDGRFADGLEPYFVDVPQRFGDGRYARLDLGQSTIRLDVFGAAFGVSTANAVWGPAQIDPLILGANAAGIPRMFVGTSAPVSWGLGTVHARLESGRMEQSNSALTGPDSSRRLMAGIVGVVTLRGLPGLELGASRFFHRQWSRSAFGRGFEVPFEALFKERLRTKDSATSAQDNQLASIFLRWTVPKAGIEAYGEYGRNDHAQDLRDLVGEPDHTAAYTVGLQRVWSRGADRLVALRIESMNSRITHLARVRAQARFVQHTTIRQGHTHHGELLGSAAGLGGSATTIGLDRYAPDGRWTVELARRIRQQPPRESASASEIDVYNMLRVERRRITRRVDLTLGAAAIAELNRDFRRDAFNLRLDAGWRWR